MLILRSIYLLYNVRLTYKCLTYVKVDYILNVKYERFFESSNIINGELNKLRYVQLVNSSN